MWHDVERHSTGDESAHQEVIPSAFATTFLHLSPSKLIRNNHRETKRVYPNLAIVGNIEQSRKPRVAFSMDG